MPVYAVIHLIGVKKPHNEFPHLCNESSDEDDYEMRKFKETHLAVLCLVDIKDYEHRRSADGFYEWFSWVCQRDQTALEAR